MTHQILTSRRSFLRVTGGLAAGLVLPALSGSAWAAATKQTENKEAEVGPVEDLMREHGLLRRVLLVYEEALRRLEGAAEPPFGVVADAAGIIRRVVEDYHEKMLEQDQLFPRFEKAGKHVELVKVLYAQHQAGRRLTDVILEAAKPSSRATQNLSQAIRAFIRMYRPHAAREDTVLFPALREIVSPAEFSEMGDSFEEKEEELLGRNGFEKMVEAVAELEKKLGIDDLARFTPSV